MAGAPPGGDGGGGLSPHAPSLRVVAAPRGGPARLRAAGRRADSFVVGLLELQEGLSAPHFVWSLSPRGAAGRLGAARRRPDSFVVGLLNPKRACRTLASFHSLPPRGGPARLRAAGRRADSFVVGLLELQEGLSAPRFVSLAAPPGGRRLPSGGRAVAWVVSPHAPSLRVDARVAARCGRSLRLSGTPQAGLRPGGRRRRRGCGPASARPAWRCVRCRAACSARPGLASCCERGAPGPGPPVLAAAPASSRSRCRRHGCRSDARQARTGPPARAAAAG